MSKNNAAIIRAVNEIPERIRDRLHDSCVKSASGGCWEWLLFKDKDGYGMMKVLYSQVRAIRMMFYLYNPHLSPDNGKLICHTCDNPSCVAPYHLYEGTAKDNAQDMTNRNRCIKDYRKALENGAAKLTVEQVREIYIRLCENECYRKVAADYGIGKGQTIRIRSRQKWGTATQDLFDAGVRWDENRKNRGLVRSLNNPHRKLEVHQIRDIYIRSCGGESVVSLATEFAVCGNSIKNIRNRYKWNEVTQDLYDSGIGWRKQKELPA